MPFETINDIFILSKDGENRSIKMDYESLNDKIVKSIEENYLKDFYKEVKKIKIILVGYNAGQQKDLRVLKEYGWEIINVLHDENWLYYYITTRPTSKMNIEFYMKKRMCDDILEYEYDRFDHHFSKAIIDISIDKTDEMYKIIEQLEKVIPFNPSSPFGNNYIKYVILHKEGGYILSILHQFID